MKDEYNLMVVMLRNAYILYGEIGDSLVKQQIRTIYNLLETKYKDNNRTKIVKNHKKHVKQYLHVLKTYDRDIILANGKTTIGILE